MRHFWILGSCLLIVGCGGGRRGDADGDADADADSDADSDADTDADTDADSDTDADGDGDADGDADLCDDPDRDDDGHDALACDGDDCDDGDASVSPDAIERLPVDVPVDADYSVGEDAALTIDDDGTVWVAYHQEGKHAGDEELRVAVQRPGEEWSYATVDVPRSANETGLGNSIALDSSGHPHVVYYDAGGGGPYTLFHAVRDDGGAWAIEPIRTSGGGHGTSIAIDADDVVHVLFWGNNEALRHAWNEDGVWTSEILAEGEEGQGALAIAPDGTLHAVLGYSVLRHAIRRDGAWELEDLDAPAEVEHPALLVDDDGALHVAYGRSTFNPLVTNLVYMTNASGGWVSTVVDPADDAGRDPSIVRADDGAIGIAYRRNNDAMLWMAWGQPDAFTLTQLDPVPGGTWIRGLSAALAPDGDVTIAHRPPGVPNLYVLTFPPPNGVDDDCDGTTF